MSKLGTKSVVVAGAVALSAAFAPLLVLAAPKTFSELVYFIISYINPIAGILASVAVLVFFFGIAKYIFSAGDGEGHDKGRELIVWGVISLFVLFSVWSLAQLVVMTFFGSGGGSVRAGSTGASAPIGNTPTNRPYLNLTPP